MCADPFHTLVLRNPLIQEVRNPFDGYGLSLNRGWLAPRTGACSWPKGRQARSNPQIVGKYTLAAPNCPRPTVSRSEDPAVVGWFFRACNPLGGPDSFGTSFAVIHPNYSNPISGPGWQGILISFDERWERRCFGDTLRHSIATLFEERAAPHPTPWRFFSRTRS
jgi:hypothetical protein